MNDAFDAETSLRDEIAAAIEADAPAAREAPAEARALDVETPEPDPPADAPEPPSPETVAAPAAWSAAAKARFQTLDPVVQQEVLKREKDMDAGKAQWDQKGERLNRLEAVIGP